MTSSTSTPESESVTPTTAKTPRGNTRPLTLSTARSFFIKISSRANVPKDFFRQYYCLVLVTFFYFMS